MTTAIQKTMSDEETVSLEMVLDLIVDEYEDEPDDPSSPPS